MQSVCLCCFVLIGWQVIYYDMDIEKKYLNDELTVDELNKLREDINGLSDEELANRMYANWVAGVGKKEVSFDAVRLKRKIDSNISARHSLAWYLTRAAAFVALPLCVAFAAFKVYELNCLYNEKIVLATSVGEQVNVLLPDSTVIDLKAMSTLAYDNSYSKNRYVSFKGEGFFDVRKNPEHPFVIQMENAKIEVLGTSFNLNTCNANNEVEVWLQKGHIKLTSESGKSEDVYDNQRAILNLTTGAISVADVKDDVFTRLKEELLFHNASFSDVIKSIENTYGVHVISNDCVMAYADDVFSGTLPSNRLKSALEILSKVYQMDYQINGKEVIFTK